jgi:hypothetical protein
VKAPTFLAIAALFLPSCATRVTKPYESSFYTKVKFDPYSGGYSVVGKELDMGGFPNVTKVRLQGAFDKHGKAASYQLHVYHIGQTTWRFLDFYRASDAQANLIPLHQLRRDRVWGTVQEEVALDLTREYLDSHKDTGMEIPITGRYGDIVIKVPGPYITGFLDKFELERKFNEPLKSQP